MKFQATWRAGMKVPGEIFRRVAEFFSRKLFKPFIVLPNAPKVAQHTAKVRQSKAGGCAKVQTQVAKVQTQGGWEAELSVLRFVFGGFAYTTPGPQGQAQEPHT